MSTTRGSSREGDKSLPLGGERRATERGAIVGWKASPHVAVFRWTGHAEGPFVELVEKLVRPLETPRRVFHDLSELEGYETEARTGITGFGVSVLSSTARFDVFASSRIVRMGVSVISIPLLGKLYSHGTHASLCAEIDAVVAADHGPAGFSTLVGLRGASRARR
jgi:hypothetical protein